ncbi:MAG: hypothetical protein OEV85_06285 [Candidatus Thorarchaeota archaeon]|nr:hypothetical protein [Candidatus Thorarchaeota archaeon]
MVSRDLVLAVIIGIIIFETDLVFGWLTMVSGPIPVIFIMAVIIGIIAGKIGYALLSTLLTWVFGILIAILIAPMVFVDYLAPEQSYLTLFVFVVIYSLRGVYSFTYEGDLIEVIIVGLLYLVVMIIISPIIYLSSFIFAVAGGVIGRVLRDSLMKKEAPSPQQSAPATTEPQ